jgi:hypothetical protein
MRQWLIGSVSVVACLAGLGAAADTREVPRAAASAARADAPPTRISEDDAVARVLNELRPTDAGVELSHPGHRVEFDAVGLRLTPRRGGPVWRWSLEGAAPVRPEVDGATVVYRRGPLLERYVPRRDSVEQQFVLERRPGGTLVIDGSVKSAGRFERSDGGWRWRTNAGAVTLGGVTVLDARGARLPARMEVRRDRTRITVGREALARATYPVVVDPEIGPNDFRISDMGSNVEDAQHAAVAYNSQANEYLVVWHADDKTWPLVDGELEIFSARVDAATGLVLGSFVDRVSHMGADGDANSDALNPAIAYNPVANQYFVVWEGDDGSGALANDEFDIYGQRLDAAAMAVGSTVRLSGGLIADGNPGFDAFEPAVAFNATAGEYLVVWRSDETPGFVNDEFDVFVQRVTAATGAKSGTNVQISDLGPVSNAAYDALDPTVVSNSQNGDYLVAWWGDDNTSPLVDDEFEIFGQRLNSSAAEVGSDFRISFHDGDASLDAQNPAVAYDSVDNNYLVVWEGEDSTATLVPGELEIFGQRVSSTGAAVGKDIRISDAGPTNDSAYDATDPAVSYNPDVNEYLIVWRADDNGLTLADNEFEIFGQRLNAANGDEVGTNDFRLSDLGPAGNTAFSASLPAVAYSPQADQYVVVWEGDDDTLPLVDNEFEIFAQNVSAAGGQVGTNDDRVSHAGRDDEAGTSAAVAYNSQANEYLVVWEANDNTPPLADTEYEVFGQRVNAADGSAVGTNDFRISDAGPVGDINFTAREPAVAYSSQANEYLVVWQGTDDTAPLVQGEQEIFGQLLSATGTQVGIDDFRISDVGPNGDTNFTAGAPAVVYNSQANEYLVVWSGDHNAVPLVDNELEIFGQRLTAAGSLAGANDFRISHMGPDGNTSYAAVQPAVAYNSQGNEYLVAWRGDDDAGTLVDNEFEIFGQRLTAAGGLAGTNDFRISDMGPDGNVAITAFNPALAYNPQANEYLVVWEGDDDTGALVDEEFEIYAQRLDAAGAAVGTNDFRLSDMGSDGNNQRDANEPSAAYDVQANEYLVVWSGDDSGETEIFGQRVSAAGSQEGTNDFRLSDVGPDGALGFVARAPAVAYGTTPNAHLVVWDADDTGGTFDFSDDVDIYGQRFTNAVPTAVTVVGFTARRVRSGVELRWRSTFEAGLLGFEIRRGGVRVNHTLHRARGLGGPATYRLVDPGRRRGEYRLVAVLLDGSRRVLATARSVP